MLSPSLRKEIRQMAPIGAVALLIPLIAGFAPLPAGLRHGLLLALAALGSCLIATVFFSLVHFTLALKTAECHRHPDLKPCLENMCAYAESHW